AEGRPVVVMETIPAVAREREQLCTPVSEQTCAPLGKHDVARFGICLDRHAQTIAADCRAVRDQLKAVPECSWLLDKPYAPMEVARMSRLFERLTTYVSTSLHPDSPFQVRAQQRVEADALMRCICSYDDEHGCRPPADPLDDDEVFQKLEQF